MSEAADRSGIFAGDDPFVLAQAWLEEAEKSEPNDPAAMALATVDSEGLPNVRIVLLKQIEADAFVFYTNYESRKSHELDTSKKAAISMHWKSLRRQVRIRGHVERESGPKADHYFASRSLKSRLGAWASHQSQPLASRRALMAEVAKITATKGLNPPRPPFWGGYRIVPIEFEFWADGAHRLHDRFRWSRADPSAAWQIVRLSP
ncbi:MAG: pyridoxamine 5'-phosphate oxidase [Pseudomonadota bacterium]